MPVLFLGHGSPMNAIESNDFTRSLNVLGQNLPRPKAILCVSAHWITQGTWVTYMKDPKTIHDFYGFPEELFRVQYPAPGSIEVADQLSQRIQIPKIGLDDSEWGLDHGTWSLLKHMYPKADIPVLQLSLDIKKPAQFHYELGQKLKFMRDEGVLILGSGNIVHNLRKISWDTQAKPWDWAVEFDAWVKEKIRKKDFMALVKDCKKTDAGKLSIPTWEHYYPLLYILGATHLTEKHSFVYEGMQNGSISMTSVGFGLAEH